MSDASDLVHRLREGDEDSFTELVKTRGPRLLKLAKRLMRSEEEARDAFQDAMLSVAKEIASFEGKSNLATWLHRVVVNACLMRLRKTSRAEELIEDLMPRFDERDCRVGERLGPTPPADALLEREQTRAHVRAAIDKLPDGYREVLILRDIEEMSAVDVATVLSVKPNLVNVRLHRARAALKKMLETTVFIEETRSA